MKRRPRGPALVIGLLLCLAPRAWAAGLVPIVKDTPLIGLLAWLPRRTAAAVVPSSISPRDHVALQALWRSSPSAYSVSIVWYGPDGSAQDDRKIRIEGGWTRSAVLYRGRMPMGAGRWQINVIRDSDGGLLGLTYFDVSRQPTPMPVRVRAEAVPRGPPLLPDLSYQIASECTAALSGTAASMPSAPASVRPGSAMLVFSLYKDGELRSRQLVDWSRVPGFLASQEARTEGTAVLVSVLSNARAVSASQVAAEPAVAPTTGFFLRRGGFATLLAPLDVSRLNLVNGTDILGQLCVDSGLPEDAWQSADAKVLQVDAAEFRLEADGSPARQIVEGRTVAPVGTSESFLAIRASVDRAVTWYLANQRENGSLMYSYFPSSDFEPADDFCVRDLNAFYVLAEISANTASLPLLRAAVERAVQAYRDSIVHQDFGDYVAGKGTLPDSNIADTAFFLLTLLSLDSPQDARLREGLVSALISKQDAAGRWSTDFLNPDVEVDQLYYPGETMLALMSYYEATHDLRARNAVVKGFDYYRGYWAGKKSAPFVPWQVRAVAKLYAADPRPEYRDYVFSLEDWLLDTHPPAQGGAADDPEGSLLRAPDATGVLAEGTAAAYGVAKAAGDGERMRRYGKALAGLIHHVLALQYHPADLFCFPRPSKIDGAFAMSASDNYLRLDSTYHSISAMEMVLDGSISEAEWEKLRGP